MGYFDGKRVFLVGGSEGIGLESAKALARQGAHVVVAARRQGPLDECVTAMEAQRRDGQLFGCISLDVTDREAVRASVPKVLEMLGGKLDVLITNVGAARPSYIRDMTDADADAMMSVNYMGHVNVFRAYLEALEADGRGDACFVSSAMGYLALPGFAAYSASKFAVVGFAEAARTELKHRGVRVTVYYPGTTETPGLKTENESKPLAVWRMEADNNFAKTYSAEEAAAKLLRAIERGQFENFPGMDQWFIWFMYRRFPGLSRWMVDMEWAGARQKAEKEKGSAEI